MKSTGRFLLLLSTFWILSHFQSSLLGQSNNSPVANEHINYCQLVKVGQYYGQLALDRNRPLTADQVEYFNGSLQLVYLDSTYHLEIEDEEFAGDGLFQFKNRHSFPPSEDYHTTHTDAYTIFHGAKELYKYQHLGPECVSCRTSSLDTLNRLIMGKRVWQDYNDMWRIGPKDNRPLVHYEVIDFETFLKCYFIPDFVLPTVARLNFPAPRLICRNDTVVVECKKDIHAEQPGLVANCMLGAQVRQLPMRRLSGSEDCPGAIYTVPFVAESPCGKDTCHQYFLIENEPPQIICPPDTIVECAADISQGEPFAVSACGLPYDIEVEVTRTSGIHNCPGTTYEMRYTVRDSCDRKAYCVRTFTIDNDPPTIQCLPDTVVDCIGQTIGGRPKVKTSCDLPHDLDYSGPKLISGRHNCPEAIYEVIWTVTDSCGRSDSCSRRIIIDNKPPIIICPTDSTVACESEIKKEKPVVRTSCGQKYSVHTDGPKRISGKPNCPGTRYRITYTAIEECGRTDSCEQIFTIDNEGPTAECWSGQMAECIEYSDTMPPTVGTSCSMGYRQVVLGTKKLKGIDNCPGTKYERMWLVSDDCGRAVTCAQLITIANTGPQISCPADTTVTAFEDIIPGKVSAKVSCTLGYKIDTIWPPELVSGDHNCPGATYDLTYSVTDVCGRSDTCAQRFTIGEREYKIDCPPDKTVKCPEDIKPEAIGSWLRGEVAPTHTSKPKPVKGIPCVWEIKYYFDLECDSTVVCTQRFTIDSDPPRLSCPPDVVIQSLDEKFDQVVGVTPDCNFDTKMTESPMRLILGLWDENGSEYEITYTVTDECGKESHCIQKITLVKQPAPERTPCDCLQKSREKWSVNSGTSYLDDLKSLLKKYSVARLQKAAMDAELYDLWLNTETLGSSATYVSDFKLQDIFTSLADMTTAIKIAEELVNGSSTSALTLAAEWLTKEGTKRALSTGSIGAVFSSIKALKEFAEYLDKEIVDLNIRMFANNYVDRDPEFFNVHHFLKTYARVPEVQLSDWNAIKIREALASYAKNELGIDLGDRSRWSTDKKAYNLLATATNRFLEDVCQYHCQSKDLKFQLEKLKLQQQLIERYQSVRDHLQNLKAENCDRPHASLVEVSPGKYECQCEDGYMLSPDRSECVPYQACEAVANTKIVFNGKSYECDCIEDFEWNESRTACRKTIPDCSSYYPKTKAVWNPLIEDYECDCIDGFEWNANATECVPKAPDCQSHYPNAMSVWNTVSKQHECGCKEGFEWNADATECVPKAPDCKSHYPNTMSIWNAVSNQYECDCKEGFEWNANATECIPKAPDCSAYYPNTTAIYNDATNQYECDCQTGFEWNADETGCVAKPTGDETGYYMIKISGSGFRKGYGSVTKYEGYHLYMRYVKKGENINQLIAQWKKQALETSAKACKGSPPLCPCPPSPDIWTSGPNYQILEYSEKSLWEKYTCDRSNFNTRQACIRWETRKATYEELPCY